MTGEREFNEADRERLARFRSNLEAHRLYLRCVPCEFTRTALAGIINSLDDLTQIPPPAGPGASGR